VEVQGRCERGDFTITVSVQSRNPKSHSWLIEHKFAQQALAERTASSINDVLQRDFEKGDLKTGSNT
jgi:hypothetical protein